MRRGASVTIGGKPLLIAGFAVLAPVFLFASLFILQFLCLFLLIILATSRIYAEYLTRTLTVIRRDVELREFKRQWAVVELVVENRGFLPAFMVAVNDSTGMLPLFNDNRFACTLPPKSRAARLWKGFCSERGLFSLGPALIRGSDPFGLFPFEIRESETAKLFVYPQPCISGLKPTGGVPLGVILSQNILNEDLSRTRSLRPYQVGDEPRRINWKASARQPGGWGFSLVVNEYEATVSHPLAVFLNLDIDMYPRMKGRLFMERAIEAAAALCIESSGRRQDTGIIIYSRDHLEIIAQSRFALIPILEQLAVFKADERKDANDAPLDQIVPSASADCARVLVEKSKQFQQGTRIIYVGPDMDHDSYTLLSVLRRFHLTAEFLVIDEKAVGALTPAGNMKRYQMKEMGREIT